MELGNNTNYNTVYNADILYPIKRLPLENSYGYDIWTCYELSWLKNNGMPEAAILTLYIPSDSPFIIESKSLKLYLNSFNNKKISSVEYLHNLIKQDLEKCCGSNIDLLINNIDEFAKGENAKFSGINLDNLHVDCNYYQVKKNILQTLNISCQEELYTHLFRSNCPVTNQPDYASIYIKYKSNRQINHSSLLQYLVSYRNHPGFHEQCIEHIFFDLSEILLPEFLLVNGRFLRRGGIDINPIRSNQALKENTLENKPLIRQ